MPSSIFGGAQNQGAGVNSILSAMRSQDPAAIAQQMMQNNPQFRQFVEENRGKSPEQIAQEHGIDLSKFR